MPPSLRSTSLIGHLKRHPSDPAAWQQFVGKYGPVIHGWCRQRGLQESDAQDVTQEIFLKWSAVLDRFERAKGNFRSFLRTVALNAVRDWDRKKKEECGSAVIEAALQTREAEMDLEQRLEKEFDMELWEEAQEAVRLRVEKTTWESFRLTRQEGKTPAEAAELLGIAKSLVIRNAARVCGMLKEEASRLREQEDPTPR